MEITYGSLSVWWYDTTRHTSERLVVTVFPVSLNETNQYSSFLEYSTTCNLDPKIYTDPQLFIFPFPVVSKCTGSSSFSFPCRVRWFPWQWWRSVLSPTSRPKRAHSHSLHRRFGISRNSTSDGTSFVCKEISKSVEGTSNSRSLHPLCLNL